MFSSRPNYSSPEVNTDELGLRPTIFRGDICRVSQASDYINPTVLCGGSTAFGIGCTSDAETIASQLSADLGNCVLNLGGRAFNSTQELILFCEIANQLENIENVILFTGVNNLFLSSFSDELNAPFFQSNDLKEAMDYQALSPKRRLLKTMLAPVFGDLIDYRTVKKTGIFTNFFRRMPNGRDKDEPKHISIEKALMNSRKDLYIWKNLSKSMGFRLTYVLQPVAGWCEKKLTYEENELFEPIKEGDDSILEQVNSIDAYTAYSDGLQKMLGEMDVEFVDTNPYFRGCNDWLFVDRVHLTDKGNRLVTKILSKFLNRAEAV